MKKFVRVLIPNTYVPIYNMYTISNTYADNGFTTFGIAFV